MAERSRRRRPRRRRHETQTAASRPQRDYPACPRCEKPIRDIASAIRDAANGNPVHFDCVMQELAQSETLLPGEQLCYLGNGSFGVIDVHGKEKQLNIKRRIQYESTAATGVEWREELAARQPKPDIVLPKREEIDSGNAARTMVDRSYLDLDEEP